MHLPRTTDRRRLLVACLLVFSAATILYLPATRYPYNLLDDRALVTQNPLARSVGGQTPGGLFSVHEGYWIPVTWLSFSIEQLVAGGSPGLSHGTNGLLHAGNAVLLLLLLARLTGRIAPASLVAAAFAVHPAGVEAVAWISSRKDVLSTFLALLSLHAYVAWTRRPRAGFAAGALALFVASVLAKPMLVLLPVLLLLLDFWPLGRWRSERPAALAAAKFPFAAVGAAVAAVYLLTQKSHVTGLAIVGLGSRLAHGLVAPLFYLGMLLRPADLAFIYPIREHPYPLWLVLLTPCLVAAATWWAVRERHRFPWVLAGWFWYLATLAPVSGFVQAGVTIVMDRLVYVPGIGILLLAAGALGAALGGATDRRRLAIAAACVAGIAMLAAMQSRQLSYWRDDETLLSRTVEVAPDSGIAQWNLAITLLQKGNRDGALEHARAARLAARGDGEIIYNAGLVLDNLGRFEEAAEAFREAIALGDPSARVRAALGVALGSTGRIEEGLPFLEEARRLDPRSSEVAFNLGVALLRLGRPAEALAPLSAAAALSPGDHRALFNLGIALQGAGRPAEAADRFAEVLRIAPGLDAARRHLAEVREVLGRNAAAGDAR